MNLSEKNMAERFREALQQTEQSNDPQPVAALFRAGAKLVNLGGDHTTDARKFWANYLAQFSEIHSEFIGEVRSDQSAALEWKSAGKLPDGRPVEYRGVSLLDFDGEEVTSFRTYYDSAVFVRAETPGGR